MRKLSVVENHLTLAEVFVQKHPDAIVKEIKNKQGDIIVYVNGQTAFNKSDVNNSQNWLTMMENAYKRSHK